MAARLAVGKTSFSAGTRRSEAICGRATSGVGRGRSVGGVCRKGVPSGGVLNGTKASSKEAVSGLRDATGGSHVVFLRKTALGRAVPATGGRKRCVACPFLGAGERAGC